MLIEAQTLDTVILIDRHHGPCIDGASVSKNLPVRGRAMIDGEMGDTERR
ncbi:hypothetical protein P3T18_003756 [Paraburkholderia sp. GAS199]